ncbi:MAG: NAD-dependent epimerase/dehydratase family protein [Vulcanimicrobiaceae bacterium]
MNVRRVLITGGSGFIGFHLASRLASEGDEIVLVDDFTRGRMDDEISALCRRPNVRLVTGDLRDAAVRAELGRGYDEVYHLAAMLGVENVLRRPVDVLRIDALMTAEILEWFVAGGGEKFMFSSTSEAYAWTQVFHELPIPTPEDVPLSMTDLENPRTTYSASKVFGELCVTQYCRSARKPFVIARYHNVYGPRMGYEHVIPQLQERARSGERPLTVYSADHLRAFCYVDDAVRATVAAMRTPGAENQTFNIGNDLEETRIADLARLILGKTARSTDIVAKTAANDPIKRRCPDVGKARRLLGFAPEVSLDRGLDLTLDWYARNPRPTVVRATP